MAQEKGETVVSLTTLTGLAERLAAGWPLAGYTIRYKSSAEAEEGLDRAQAMQANVKAKIGPVLPISVMGASNGLFLDFTHSDSRGVFEYEVTTSEGRVTIDGGGCWAMQYAADAVVSYISKRDLPLKYYLKGTVEGKTLFPRPEGVNLRILDDNIWSNSSEKVPDAWKELNADPRDDVRAPQFAQLVRAYMPDVFTMQEYDRHMDARLMSRLQSLGFVSATPSQTQWNYTPILYRTAALELLKAGYLLYTPETWSNGNTKSFTSAIFKHKATGKIFAVITTHLWWKSESAQAGSTAARAAQVKSLMEAAEAIKAEYDCPIFVTGDMNCYESTEPMQLFLQAGYQPCYKIATVYGNNDNGHHVCSSEGFSRKSNRPSPYRELGAIDHCLLYNGKDAVEVKVFDCIQAYFTIKLTDHYPNLIDAELK